MTSRERVAHVDVTRGERHHPRRPGTRGEPLHAREPLRGGRVVVGARAERRLTLGIAPAGERPVHERDALLARRRPVVVDVPGRARDGRVQDEGGDAIGVLRRQPQRDRAAERIAPQRGARAADRVEDGDRVAHLVLEARRRPDPLGQAGPAAIEQDEARERGVALEEAAQARQLPHVLDLGDPTRQEQQVERALADHLVGDAHVAAARVSGRGRHRSAMSVSALAARASTPSPCTAPSDQREPAGLARTSTTRYIHRGWVRTRLRVRTSRSVDEEARSAVAR